MGGIGVIMLKHIKIVVTDYEEEGQKPHFWIGTDAVVRTRTKPTPEDDTMSVVVVAPNRTLSDAQCTSVMTLAMAAMLNYGVVTSGIKCDGITWEELTRRG